MRDDPTEDCANTRNQVMGVDRPDEKVVRTGIQNGYTGANGMPSTNDQDRAEIAGPPQRLAKIDCPHIATGNDNGIRWG